MSGLKRISELYNEFLVPSSEYRGKPFWAWNGRLEKEELLRQVQVMKEMGFGGFFMHSRTGLETEYLGDEWFELINACADEAEKLGMEAWLYDEDRWPSGIAGGMVTVNPEYRMKSVKLSIMKEANFQWDDNILAAFSCRLDGLSVFGCKRISGTVQSMNDILVFRVIEMSKNSFYNGYTYLDTLNRKATDKFLELTHEKYEAYCGDRLGKSIKGIFTDEPHRGTLMDTFGAGNDGDIWRAPWTDLLPEEFEKRFGYDLIEKLPELFLKPEGRNVSQVKWHYIELLTQLFLENFLKPVNEWCEAKGVILTGHMLHEDSLAAQTAMNGSVMRCYEHMGYPGVDVLAEGNMNYWIVKQLASAARQMGKKYLLSELYGCTGWQMDFESHKAVGDWQALFGINIRCPHLSWYTMEGEAKRDFPASILHQSTWWNEYKHVEDYFSRTGLIMGQGKPCCAVLVISPLESVWCQIHPGWSQGLDAKAEGIKELEEKYKDMFHWLAGAHMDFDYGDEDILARHYSISHDDTGEPLLKVGEATYKVVLVSGMLTIRSTTIEILDKFIEKGGTVIFAGEAPVYADVLESDAPSALMRKTVQIPMNKNDVVKALAPYQDIRVEVTDDKGNNIEDIYCQVRYDGEKYYIMLLNVNREKACRNVRVTVNIVGYVEEWQLESGKRTQVADSDGNRPAKIQTDFEAGGEHVFVILSGKDAELKAEKVLKESTAFMVEGSFAYELDETNVCVLDFACCKLGDGEWQEEKEILKTDRDIRRKLGLPLRGGEMLQPWFRKKAEADINEGLSLKFVFYIDTVPQGAVELAIERPEHFGILLNGQKVNSETASGWWIDKCFSKIPIPSEILQKGRNIIELRTRFNDSINLEALYLLGQFGVQIEGSNKTLVRLPDKLVAGDLTAQGFPFYTGKVRYRLKMDIRPAGGERVFIELEKFEAACIKVVSAGNTDKIISWKPYEADITEELSSGDEILLETVLTRRNTFGPLHSVPAILPAYGPEAFITEEDKFSKDYMLIPSGLLSEPKISIRTKYSEAEKYG